MHEYDRERLNKLLVDGKSNYYIAKEMGITVNTVAGNRNRYFFKHPELKPRPNRGGVSKGYKYKFRKAVLPTNMQPRKQRRHAARHVDLQHLNTDDCRWISNNLFCAATQVEGRPYCHKHCMLAYPAYAAKYGVHNDRRRGSRPVIQHASKSEDSPQGSLVSGSV